jgi:hypothetical protein
MSLAITGFVGLIVNVVVLRMGIRGCEHLGSRLRQDSYLPDAIESSCSSARSTLKSCPSLTAQSWLRMKP